MTGLIVISLGLVLGLLALGIPIYLVLMGVSSTLLVAEGRTVAGLGQHVLDHLQSPILISVPFFILSAVLMQGGGLAKILFDAALAWIGWLRGDWQLRGCGNCNFCSDNGFICSYYYGYGNAACSIDERAWI